MDQPVSPFPLQIPDSNAHFAKFAVPQHKRVYQACIPCRRRKVKCDLGSVDNPGDPPCVRCRRESKDCYFSATRRKRKVDGQDDSLDGYEEEGDYVIRNGRKRLCSDAGSEPMSASRSTFASSLYNRNSEEILQPPVTPGGHPGRSQPLRRQSHSYMEDVQTKPMEDPNARIENPEAQDVMGRPVFGPHDALDLLYKAATDRFVDIPHDATRALAD
jgi:hypothetical protein